MRPPQEPSPVSRTVLLLLTLPLLVGFGGLPRLYTGYRWAGLFQLMTFGGFGVWQLKDTVNLLRGRFRDHEGRLVR